MKLALAKAKVYGTAGEPGVKRGPTKYTLVPWEEVQQEKEKKAREEESSKTSVPEPRIPEAWTFSDHNAVMSGLFSSCTV